MEYYEMSAVCAKKSEVAVPWTSRHGNGATAKNEINKEKDKFLKVMYSLRIKAFLH